MDQIPVRELNQHTGRVLARVRGGEVVEVTDRGIPVARLVPVSAPDTILGRLVAEGRAIAPSTGGSMPFPPALGDPDIQIAETVAAARDDERW